MPWPTCRRCRDQPARAHGFGHAPCAACNVQRAMGGASSGDAVCGKTTPQLDTADAAQSRMCTELMADAAESRMCTELKHILRTGRVLLDCEHHESPPTASPAGGTQRCNTHYQNLGPPPLCGELVPRAWASQPHRSESCWSSKVASGRADAAGRAAPTGAPRRKVTPETAPPRRGPLAGAAVGATSCCPNRSAGLACWGRCGRWRCPSSKSGARCYPMCRPSTPRCLLRGRQRRQRR